MYSSNDLALVLLSEKPCKHGEQANSVALYIVTVVVPLAVLRLTKSLVPMETHKWSKEWSF